MLTFRVANANFPLDSSMRDVNSGTVVILEGSSMSYRGEKISRRELVKRFGLAAFVLHPLLRGMAYAAGGSSFEKAPRFVMFFKGGAFIPRNTNPSSIQNLAGTSIAALQPHASDIILFKNMNTHGGSPKTDGYEEEHAAGLLGCTTGHRYHYAFNDSYGAFTDHESIDINIANAYKSRPELSHLAFSSLHLGAAAHSDSDNSGLGQRYISFRNRVSGDTRYGNAIEPIQNAAQVYDMLMQKISNLAASGSNRAGGDTSRVKSALARRKSLVDFILSDIQDAKRIFGMDTEHSRKLDGLVDGWRQTEKNITDQMATAPAPSGGGRELPKMKRPTGNAANKSDLDELSPIQDQMISLIKLAFEWDLTRVVAFTLSGASCGQSLPSKGIDDARHTLEHRGDESSLLKIDSHYSQKFAGLLSSLKSIDDGQGQTALYNSSIILGMECWSSHDHYLTNVPYVFAGQGGGKFKTGRIIDAQDRNNNDLLISCQNAAGISSNSFGLGSLCKGPII